MYIIIISILLAISLAFVIYKGFWTSAPSKMEHFYVATSNIAGEGLFATEPAIKDQRLFKALDLDHTIRQEVR